MAVPKEMSRKSVITRCHAQTCSSASQNALPSSSNTLSHRLESQLASPPTSSDPPMPLSPAGRHQSKIKKPKTKARGKKDLTQMPLSPVVDTDADTSTVQAFSSHSPTLPNQSSPEPESTIKKGYASRKPASKICLTEHEKSKLLKISCMHMSKFLGSAALGSGAEKDVWISVLNDFSETVHPGFFTKYTDVREKVHGLSKARLYKIKGTTPSKTDAQAYELGKWSDQWVRVWRCRRFIINAADFHRSLLEMVGEKKLKRMLRYRLKGSKLPKDLGELTFSALIWKAIQKEISTLKREAVEGNYRLDPEEADSDWTDEDDSEDESGTERMDDEPPLRSIEDDLGNGPTPTISADTPASPHAEINNPVLRDPSPATLQALQEYEQHTIAWLKEEKRKTNGKQVSIRDLAYCSSVQQGSPTLRTLDTVEASRESYARAQWVGSNGNGYEYEPPSRTPRVRPFSDFTDGKPATVLSVEEHGKILNVDTSALATKCEPPSSTATTDVNMTEAVVTNKVHSQQDAGAVQYTATTLEITNPFNPQSTKAHSDRLPDSLGRSRETTSQRTLRTFNEEETRKHQKPLVPQQVPYRSSPVKGHTPQIAITSKTEIGPPRFYGKPSTDSSDMSRIEQTAERLAEGSPVAESHEQGAKREAHGLGLHSFASNNRKACSPGASALDGARDDGHPAVVIDTNSSYPGCSANRAPTWATSQHQDDPFATPSPSQSKKRTRTQSVSTPKPETPGTDRHVHVTNHEHPESIGLDSTPVSSGRPAKRQKQKSHGGGGSTLDSSSTSNKEMRGQVKYRVHTHQRTPRRMRQRRTTQSAASRRQLDAQQSPVPLGHRPSNVQHGDPSPSSIRGKGKGRGKGKRKATDVGIPSRGQRSKTGVRDDDHSFPPERSSSSRGEKMRNSSTSCSPLSTLPSPSRLPAYHPKRPRDHQCNSPLPPSSRSSDPFEPLTSEIAAATTSPASSELFVSDPTPTPIPASGRSSGEKWSFRAPHNGPRHGSRNFEAKSNHGDISQDHSGHRSSRDTTVFADYTPDRKCNHLDNRQKMLENKVSYLMDVIWELKSMHTGGK
ncbi:hypothetical protein F5B20DRAFT_498784 [Whalleya microplaca]|nr:hypothetical protein F5B20DRAFT_498784 [Whalleya microplaca]